MQEIEVDISRYLDLPKSISVKNKLFNNFLEAKVSTRKNEFDDKHKSYRNLILTLNGK